jgi:NitT/TauT family transport system substrate-binding protein
MEDFRTATRRALVHAFVLLAGMASAMSVCAEQIVVSNYGVSPNGMPFAVALEKGFFKDAGVTLCRLRCLR